MNFVSTLVVVATSGFLSLSYEILWYRAFSFASGGAPWVFGRVLAAFLIGLAQGSVASRRFVTASRITNSIEQLRVVGVALTGASASAYLVIPLLAWLAAHRAWQAGFLLVVGAAFLMGLVLPLVSHLGIAPNAAAGKRLSYLYFASIIGSASGSLVTGFVLTDRWSVETISIALAVAGVALGSALTFGAAQIAVRTGDIAGSVRTVRVPLILVALAAVAIALHHPLFEHVYERLLYKAQADKEPPFAELVETRGGVVAVTPDRVVYGGGVYDGMIETDLVRDSNLLVRAYALGAMHLHPSQILVIGLGTGAWTDALLRLPQVEHVTAVEINAGYLRVISRHPEVRGLLDDPRVTIVVDDARRWLAHHPDEKFDAIVMNTTWYWRAHSTNLLSREFLQLTRDHLASGGIFYYNTTWSPDAMKTGFSAFPYGIRCLNFIALSDSPILFDTARWSRLLHGLRGRDGSLVLAPGNPLAVIRLDSLLALGRSINEPPVGYGLERRESVMRRVSEAHIITDDNMRVEWRATKP